MDRFDPPDEQQAADMVVVGRVQGPYGVHGWIRLATFTDPPENIRRYSPWLIRPRTGSQRWQPLEVLEIRPHKQGFVARLAGCSDRNAAAELQGHDIGVSAACLPAPDTDEYYWRDLLGMVVVNRDGTRLGRVRDLVETGAHDVLVVASEAEAQDQPDAECMIPFHRNYVLEVDPAERVIRVDWKEN